MKNLLKKLTGGDVEPQDAGMREYISGHVRDAWTCSTCGVINSVTAPICQNPHRRCTQARPAWAKYDLIPLDGDFTRLTRKDNE